MQNSITPDIVRIDVVSWLIWSEIAGVSHYLGKDEDVTVARLEHASDRGVTDSRGM